MKTIKDQHSGVDVTINIINSGHGATLTMCAGGGLITQAVRGADYTAAKVAYAKRDLDGFGALFDRADRAEAA